MAARAAVAHTVLRPRTFLEIIIQPYSEAYTRNNLFTSMSGRKDFLSQQAPENYVAGLGRGEP